MATITVYASTGVANIDIRCSNGYTTSIGAGGSFSWTRLAPNDYLSITNADGQSGYGGPYYANGVNIGGGDATYYIRDGDQDIYVRATAKAYTITFYANGGSGRMSSLTGGTTYTMPSCQFTREGYTFSRWNTNSRGTGTSYYAGRSYTFSANTPLYAIWNINTYTITFDRNGGSGGPISGTKVYNVPYTIPSYKPKKTGYIFIYWVDNLESGKHWSPGDNYTTNSNVTFTAIWRRKTYFYWHGSDASDSTYFAVGKRIDLAVTAEAWNRLCDFVNEVRGYAGLSAVAFSTVSAGDEISAVKHTIVSNAIKQIVNAGYGTVVPATVSTGDEIVTSLYNGNGSLKDAINKAVDDL